MQTSARHREQLRTRQVVGCRVSRGRRGLVVETREKARAGGQSNEDTPLENGMSLISPVTWTVASSLATG